jgi:hypothetical protein
MIHRNETEKGKKERAPREVAFQRFHLPNDNQECMSAIVAGQTSFHGLLLP